MILSILDIIVGTGVSILGITNLSWLHKTKKNNEKMKEEA
jgi:hypothetical protein